MFWGQRRCQLNRVDFRADRCAIQYGHNDRPCRQSAKITLRIARHARSVPQRRRTRSSKAARASRTCAPPLTCCSTSLAIIKTSPICDPSTPRRGQAAKRPRNGRGNRHAQAPAWAARSSACCCSTTSAILRAIWFNMPFMADKFRRGQEVLLSGKPKLSGGRWEMTHPRVQWIDAEEGAAASGELLPVYALTDEPATRPPCAESRTQAVDAYVDFVEERFPEGFLVAHGLWPIGQRASRDPFSHQQRQLTASSPPLHLSGNA